MTNRTVRFHFAVLSMSLILAGCVKSDVTRRYKSVEYRTEEGLVEVSAFVRDVPPSPRQPLALQLAGEGQAAYIQAVEKKNISVETLRTALAGLARDPSAKEDVIDRTVFHKRIILSAAPNLSLDTENSIFNPGSRIDRLSFSLELVNQQCRFADWNRFSTLYDTVDLGQLALTQSNSFALQASSGNLPIPANVSAQADWGRNMKEEVVLRQRYIVLSGILSSKRAVLFQEGIAGIDLTGEATVDMTVKCDRDSLYHVLLITGLSGGSQEPSAESKEPSDEGKELPDEAAKKDKKDDSIQIERVPLMIPATSEAITILLTADYRIRQIKKGAESFLECDDDVRLVSGAARIVMPMVTLVTEKEMQAARHYWCIGIRKREGFLYVHVGKKGPALFPTYRQADEFLHWIKKGQNKTICGQVLWLSPEGSAETVTLTDSDIEKLIVEIRPEAKNPPPKPSAGD